MGAIFTRMTSSNLRYPFPSPPVGGLCELALGVRWIRLPLPLPLAHINVWALDDEDGWAVVDTGTHSDPVVSAWQELLAQAPLALPLKRVFVTHMHPDHIGMAGWLTRKFDAPLLMTRLEYLSCRALVADTGRETPADALRFYAEAGWPQEAIDKYQARFGGFGKLIHALPDSFKRLTDGQVLRIGSADWEVVTGNGHSPDHACLYCPSRKLLISGDQVLPRISSNVSVHPTEPDADPMSDWMTSLDKLESRVPDDVLVLPAHGDCFEGLHARIRALRDDQFAALLRLQDVLREKPRRVVDVFGALFTRPIDAASPHLHLATGESIACLNHLIYRGEARRSVRDGVAWYAAA